MGYLPMKRCLRLFSLLLCLLLLAGCGRKAEEESATLELFAMDTYMTLSCSGPGAEEALAEAKAELLRLDALLSTGSENSEIARINRDGNGCLSPESLAMVQQALTLWEDTDGAFDITIYPLMELWGFTGDSPARPTEEEREALLPLCSSSLLTLEESRLTLTEGQGIDLGGIAKGYASTRLMGLFRSRGITSAVVSLGGNVQALGSKPDGSPWRCGIRDPFHPENPDSFLGIVSIRDQAVITSGAYERNFTDEADGETYHHILDPKTGMPAESGLISVTVVSSDGCLADGLSTACYVMGAERSLAYWQQHSDRFDLILMDETGQVTITAGLEDCFESCYPLTVYS